MAAHDTAYIYRRIFVSTLRNIQHPIQQLLHEVKYRMCPGVFLDSSKVLQKYNKHYAIFHLYNCAQFIC